MRHAPRALALALALAGSPAGGAEPVEEPGPEAAAIFDAVTVVAGGVEERLGEVAGTATRIDRAELDRRLVQGPSDLVRHLPGVAAASQAGRFGFAGFRIRGVDGNRVAVEVDGAPAPAAFAVGSFAAAGRGWIEPELLDSAEILRGPASALHGSDALGGVVSFTTLGPAEILDGGTETWSARASADTRDGGLHTSLLGAVARGPWQALALAVRRTASELDAGGAVEPDPAAGEETSLLLRATRAAGDGLVELSASGSSRRLETDVRHLRHGPGQFASTERLLADDRAEEVRLGLVYRTVHDRSWIGESDARLAFRSSSTIQSTLQDRSADGRTPHATRRERRFELDDERLEAGWTGRSSFTTADLRHRMIWGAEASRSSIRERRDGLERDLVTGSATRTVLGELLPVRDFPVSTVDALALFAADEIVLGATGRWRLLPALRFDRTATDARADRLYRDDFPSVAVVDTDDRGWTPKLGVTRELPGGHSLFGQYGEGFRAPPFYDVNVGLRLPALGYEAIPNPDLRPERSRGFEVGWRVARPALAAELALYDNRYRDLIESRAPLGQDPATGLTRFQSVNRDRARIAGAEARVRVELGWLGSAARGWSLDANGAWARGEDTRRREPLNSVDPAELNVALGYAPPGGAWSVRLVGTRVASKRGEVDESVLPLFAPPGYALLDLYAEWRPRPSWALHVALLNVLDETYWTWAGLPGVLAADPQLDFHAAPGRGVVAGLSLRR